jgi:dCTP diphosphatase
MAKNTSNHESGHGGTGQSDPNNTDLLTLREKLRKFVADREWEQFHTPRNLLLALVGEVGELTELFQWLSDEEAAMIMRDQQLGPRVRQELADVFGYVLRLADVLEIDLYEALREKIRLNGERYPADLARGKATKYTDLRD